MFYPLPACHQPTHEIAACDDIDEQGGRAAMMAAAMLHCIRRHRSRYDEVVHATVSATGHRQQGRPDRKSFQIW